MMFPSIKVSNRNDIFVLVSLFCFFLFFFALSTRSPSIHLRTKVKFLLLTKLNKERVVFYLLFGPALLNVQSTSICHNH